MPDPTAPTRYVEAWAAAASALAVEIAGPLDVELPSGAVVCADMLVKGFGAPKGTLVFSDPSEFFDHRAELQSLGFSASTFGPYDVGAYESPEELMELLSEWGWCGEGAAPRWLGEPGAREPW